MRCEICGKYLLKGKSIKVEGSIIVACEKCSNYGEFVKKVEPYKKEKKAALLEDKIKEEAKEEFEIEEEEELREDFSQVIREGREKMKMKQEELGKKISQPKSLIHRIELGKFKPTPQLARKIEKILGVKLLLPQEKIDFEPKISKSGETTLGDLVIIKKKHKKR